MTHMVLLTNIYLPMSFKDSSMGFSRATKGGSIVWLPYRNTTTLPVPVLLKKVFLLAFLWNLLPQNGSSLVCYSNSPYVLSCLVLPPLTGL